MSPSVAERTRQALPDRAQAPVLHEGHHRGRRRESPVRLAGDHRIHRRSAAFVRHDERFEIGHRHEQHPRKMALRAHSRRGHIDGRAVRPGVADQLLHALHRKLGVDDEHVGRHGEATDVLEVLHSVVGDVFLQKRRDQHRAVRRADQGVPVGLRALSGFHADQAARAVAVLDEHRLAERVAQLRGDDAAHGVDRASRSVGHEHAHRAARVVLRLNGDRDECGRETGRA